MRAKSSIQNYLTWETLHIDCDNNDNGNDAAKHPKNIGAELLAILPLKGRPV